ncbi:MAG TPA: PEP-CTERM sorting domain-containing protein [Pirellulales bacterium]|nr:PEP-CTERM sorting domain-containing protein [Pirellulales bacterium]
MPEYAAAGIFQSAGPTYYGDDYHQAEVGPYGAYGPNGTDGPIPVSSITYNFPYNLYLNGECIWINDSLDNYIEANPKNGSGPSGQAWAYSWASLATEKLVQSGITVTDYFPFVVQQAAFPTENDKSFGAVGPGELGGAVIKLTYTPNLNGNGAPELDNPTWVQAYEGTSRGHNFGPILDNGGVVDTSSSNSKTPYYAGAKGTINGTNPTQTYFADEPVANENEYENNPVVALQFQTVLATDVTSTLSNGKTLNTVTLYGGEWWGFTYSANDAPPPPPPAPPPALPPFNAFPMVPTPEPSTFVLAGLGGIGLAIATYRRRRQLNTNVAAA